MPLKALNNLDLDISQPVISRDGNWIALSARDAENVVTKQVWVMDADGNLVEVVTKESNYTHASVRWDPEGKYLVYQRFNVNSSDSLPEVWLWSREESSRWMLASDAALPKWYP